MGAYPYGTARRVGSETTPLLPLHSAPADVPKTTTRVWSANRHQPNERNIKWLTKPAHRIPRKLQQLARLPQAAPSHPAPHVLPAPQADPAVPVALAAVPADASSSAARRSASSAPRRSTPSATATSADRKSVV